MLVNAARRAAAEWITDTAAMSEAHVVRGSDAGDSSTLEEQLVNSALSSFITRALEEVCFGSDKDLPLKETIDRYFAADFVEVVDGTTFGHDEFTAHMGRLRALVTGGRVEVLAAIREGDGFAHRHLLHVTGADGSTMRREVYMFGQFAADGRLLHIDEVSRDAA